MTSLAFIVCEVQTRCFFVIFPLRRIDVFCHAFLNSKKSHIFFHLKKSGARFKAEPKSSRLSRKLSVQLKALRIPVQAAALQQQATTRPEWREAEAPKAGRRGRAVLAAGKLLCPRRAARHRRAARRRRAVPVPEQHRLLLPAAGPSERLPQAHPVQGVGLQESRPQEH